MEGGARRPLSGATSALGFAYMTNRNRTIGRRHLVAGASACGVVGAFAGGRLVRAQTPQPAAPSPPAQPAPLPRRRIRLQPFDLRADQITDIKVCLRPFRAMGPRFDVEHVGNKLVFHNYGHGGSGWSLSWGSASVVVEKVSTTLQRKVAVIGCGIIGLTTALTAQRAGFDVTIYTKDLLPRTRSVRANGSWTPDSRISLTAPAGPEFADLWERMARISWATYRDYLGLPGNPVEFIEHFSLSDRPFDAPHEERPDGRTGDYASTGMPQHGSEFARYSGRIKDIVPAAEELTPAESPFAAPYAKRGSLMLYNFASYGHLLMSEFFQAGGHVVIREFHDPSELTSLPEKVIINCPGYAARDWWNDKSLIPVRGQTAWLPPRPDLPYGLHYHGASAVSKTDGLMVQAYDLDNEGEMGSVGNSFEHPDRSESERAIKVLADLFARSPISEG